VEGTVIKGKRGNTWNADSSDSISDIDILQQRKKEGIRIPLNNDVQARESSNYLEYVKLIHNALPELDYDGIDTSCTF
jgi:isopentenyl-diphosphate delta-isomerase